MPHQARSPRGQTPRQESQGLQPVRTPNPVRGHRPPSAGSGSRTFARLLLPPPPPTGSPARLVQPRPIKPCPAHPPSLLATLNSPERISTSRRATPLPTTPTSVMSFVALETSRRSSISDVVASSRGRDRRWGLLWARDRAPWLAKGLRPPTKGCFCLTVGATWVPPFRVELLKHLFLVPSTLSDHSSGLILNWVWIREPVDRQRNMKLLFLGQCSVLVLAYRRAPANKHKMHGRKRYFS
ncbi:uncharacterized protein LOC123634828 [Lemur catta]|uniref:uncharacterized protein LOC123634828 n=1 Tax=Lemur catta TaxID=9447 RepID=UPI001E266A8B|nr:uncharacterized protein LOC123634828 [Lemur catta]